VTTTNERHNVTPSHLKAKTTPGIKRGQKVTAPLRKIIDREGSCYSTIETLECGHLHEPKMHPAYPERHLEAKSRRCLKCEAEVKGETSRPSKPVPAMYERNELTPRR
jgi:hypothetical protein